MPFANIEALTESISPLVVSEDEKWISRVAKFAVSDKAKNLTQLQRDGATAVDEACFLAREHGAISSYLYSTDEAFIDAALDNYTRSGMNLSVNLHGGMWANFAAAYSDYHVTGLNPAGNACLTDLAFVANRFRIVHHSRPAPRIGENNGA
jgi:hypothetical protein